MLRFVFCLLLCSSTSFAASNPPKVEFKAITAEPLSKNSLTFVDLKGKVVIVDFWASWCEPCKEALPHYNKLYEKYKNQGVVFIGINEDDDLKERDAFLKAHPISFPVFFDKEKQMAKDFQVVALPTLFVFDKKLKPVILYRGFDDKKPQVLEKGIQDLLKAQK
ncbi:TlpA disulfide reductase family protein [Bdellovibrio svalbardensis]|uniref:TlpA family protein disulfide reductase n=1 Tax=Bdellovibrio svalbardensis TaxID=2972972 RepID=A0ABT6DHQ5_9BACT|nr:TlpA disulfide reductase family protein [Bdellovibrio svalbardensis]MDG0816357.1 TlpA family protein disulfide reductase [Bdellovibrio svalbardensis]